MTPLPSTSWTLGPNRRTPNLLGLHPTWTPRVQLLNMEPGEFWVPALQTELETGIILQPFGAPNMWRSFSANFSWNQRWHPTRLITIIRYRANGSEAFVFNSRYAVQELMKNTLTDPAGNYSINGSMNFQWGPI